MQMKFACWGWGAVCSQTWGMGCGGFRPALRPFPPPPGLSALVLHMLGGMCGAQAQARSGGKLVIAARGAHAVSGGSGHRTRVRSCRTGCLIGGFASTKIAGITLCNFSFPSCVTPGGYIIAPR